MVKYLRMASALVIILGLAIVSNRLAKLNANIEFPIYAALLGIVLGNIPYVGVFLRSGGHTEFFIKIGLVLLGASINFAVVMSVGARGLLQAIIGMPLVFFFTWYVCKWFHLEDKLRAVLATAVSICGVSAAIGAAGSILAKKEHLTYVIALVTLFALPLMVLMPYLARLMNLSMPVAGAWIGNNIDTTAAVTGAAQLYGDGAIKVASIVKMSQNLFIGLACFLLALYFALKGEPVRIAPETGTHTVCYIIRTKPRAGLLWDRFPKFILGFMLVVILVSVGGITKPEVTILNNLRNWFFCLAFVCIGLGFNFKEFLKVGGKPLAVFAIATVFNTVTALGLAWLLFGSYRM